MVWIYGGSFCSGEVTLLLRAASVYFMRKDVILVTVQRRFAATGTHALNIYTHCSLCTLSVYVKYAWSLPNLRKSNCSAKID